MHSKTSKHIKPFSKYSIALFAAAIFLGTGGWFFAYVWHWRHLPHVLDVYCFSVDGDLAVFIRTPQGRKILIDGGKSDTIIHDITSVMPFYDRKIDTLVLSNDDDSHATGLVSVLDRYTVGNVIEMDAADDRLAVLSATSSSYSIFENLIDRKNISDEKVLEGERADIGELAEDSTILFPPGSSPPFKFSKTNTPTLAFTFSYGSTTLFFGGLVTKTEQKYIAEEIASSSDFSADGHSSDVLLILPKGENVGATDEEFIDSIHPTYVVISKKPRPPVVRKPIVAETESVASSSKSHKSSKPPKPPFDISTVPGISIQNIAVGGDTEFVSDGLKFSERKI